MTSVVFWIMNPLQIRTAPSSPAAPVTAAVHLQSFPNNYSSSWVWNFFCCCWLENTTGTAMKMSHRTSAGCQFRNECCLASPNSFTSGYTVYVHWPLSKLYNPVVSDDCRRNLLLFMVLGHSWCWTNSKKIFPTASKGQESIIWTAANCWASYNKCSPHTSAIARKISSRPIFPAEQSWVNLDLLRAFVSSIRLDSDGCVGYCAIPPVAMALFASLCVSVCHFRYHRSHLSEN